MTERLRDGRDALQFLDRLAGDASHGDELSRIRRTHEGWINDGQAVHSGACQTCTMLADLDATARHFTEVFERLRERQR